MKSPSEISHEQDEKKGKAEKQRRDKDTQPPGKLSIRKQDGLNKKFGEDRSSRK